METKVINLFSIHTQIIADSSTIETSANFTGGLLQIHKKIAG